MITLSTVNVAAVVFYTTWVCYVLHDRHKNNGSDFNFIGTVFGLEIIYTAMMTYLLLTSPNIFLYCAIVTTVLHVLAGLHAEAFRPEVTGSRELMTKYWSILGIDVAISLSCYLLVTH